MKIKLGTLPVLITTAYVCCYSKTCAQACASTTGATNAANFSTATFPGNGFSWSNPGNAQLSDASYATGGLTLGIGSSAYADYLTIQNFGFSIPSTATICEIHVEVERSASGLGIGGSTVIDHSVRLLKNGVLYGNDLATTSAWPSSDAIATYGNALLAGTWGGSWQPVDVNSANFGVAISAELKSGLVSIAMIAKIDQVRVTVIYDPNSLLALNLENFSAGCSPDGDGHLLTWRAGGIAATSKFIVQRSGNNSSWQDLVTIRAEDHTTARSLSGSYAYTDRWPLDGANFYRLRMENADGRSVYSTVREVKGERAAVRCWPNPFNDVIHVSGLADAKRVVVKDLQGRILYTNEAAVATADWQIPAAELPPGLYFIQAGARTFRLLKQVK